jgi:hypothetical protein
MLLLQLATLALGSLVPGARTGLPAGQRCLRQESKARLMAIGGFAYLPGQPGASFL